MSLTNLILSVVIVIASPFVFIWVLIKIASSFPEHTPPNTKNRKAPSSKPKEKKIWEEELK